MRQGIRDTNKAEYGGEMSNEGAILDRIVREALAFKVGHKRSQKGGSYDRKEYGDSSEN